MKNLYNKILSGIQQVLNEELKSITLSDDATKNKIYEFLKNNMVIFKTSSVDNAIEEISHDAFIDETDDISAVTPKAKTYAMKVLNGGSTFYEGSPYTQAEICYHRNNTDVCWLLLVKGRRVSLYIRERKYYGMPTSRKHAYDFTI